MHMRLLRVSDQDCMHWKVKRKDRILSDFLFRQKHDESYPHKIILISLNMQGLLQVRYYNIGKENSEEYLVI